MFCTHGRVAFASSRYAFNAMRMLSVPPEVIEPQAVRGPFSNQHTIDSASFSIRRSEGNIVGLRALLSEQRL